MKIAIARKGNDIATMKDYTNIDGKGEISHFLIELRIIEKDLIDLWEEWHNEDLEEIK